MAKASWVLSRAIDLSDIGAMTWINQNKKYTAQRRLGGAVDITHIGKSTVLRGCADLGERNYA